MNDYNLSINSSKKRENSKGPRIHIHLITNTICLYMNQCSLRAGLQLEDTEQTSKTFSLALMYSDLVKLQSQNLKNYPQKFFGSEDIIQRFCHICSFICFSFVQVCKPYWLNFAGLPACLAAPKKTL